MTKDKYLLTRIIYLIFIVLLFLQNFALVKTESFGLNGLVVFLIIYSLFNFKQYYIRFKKSFILLFISVTIFIFLSSFVNHSFAINQILRNYMIIWLVYSSNIFMKKVFQDKNERVFFDIFIKIAFMFFTYGFYEMYANKHYLPLFMNIFSNNPSYGIRSLTQYYHGWINKARLYNVFFEPSVFATFSIYILFLVGTLKNITKKKKNILMMIIIFNIYFSYSRTGYIIIIYMLIMYIVYKLLKTKKIHFELVFLMLPFITLFFMYMIGLNIFDDGSSNIRTYSGIYYLKQSFTSTIHIIFGHATGSVLVADVTDEFVANCAHNGYVDFLYQYGIIVFIAIIAFLKSLIKKVDSSEYKYLFVGAITTCCCFGNCLAIETIVALIVIIYNYCLYHRTEEIDDN